MLSVENKPTMLNVVALLITATTISLEKGFIEFFPRQQLVTTNEKKKIQKKTTLLASIIKLFTAVIVTVS